MKLKSINLHNFRCYQDNDFYFGSDTTIIIGKNGTGKSSLLSAIRKGMTFVFSNSESNILIRNNSNKVEGLNDWDTTFIEFGGGFLWPTDIKYNIEINQEDLYWRFYKDKYAGKLHSKYYRDTQKLFDSYHLDKSSTLPLLGFYGDCYPHKRKENNKVINSFNKILTKSVVLPRDIGYTLWNSDESIVSSWFLRTKFILDEIQQDKYTLDELSKEIQNLKSKSLERIKGENTVLTVQIDALENRQKLFEDKFQSSTVYLIQEMNFVKDRLMYFFSKMNEFDSNELILFDIKKSKTYRTDYLFFSFGKEDSINEGVFNEESLPMGYQRLIHIVYDIAYRWFILNGASEKFDGLVLIDELELHLHPSLQQTVLERFRRTFPGMQFIITTHSPIILSSFNADTEFKKIIQLEKRIDGYKDEELGNLYSIDFNSSLVDVMGVNISDKLVDTYINAYNLLKKDDSSTAQIYLDKISELFNGKIPDIIKNKL